MTARTRFLAGQRLCLLCCRFLHFIGPQHLAVRAIAAYLSTREHDLKSEMRFRLAAKLRQRFSEKLFHFSAPQANDMRVLLLHAGFVEVLISADVHEV